MAVRAIRHPEAGRRALVNGRLFDPASDIDQTGGVLLEDGIIKWLGDAVCAASVPDSTEVTDVNGALILPGLIDMRVFTGEPGSEHRETLHSASRAAAAGGVTSLVLQPNTAPVMDDASIIDFVLRRAQDTADVRIYPMAAITKGLGGEQMAEFGLLKEAGAVALTDAVQSVANSRVLSRAMKYAGNFGMLIVQHVEDPHLAGGVMNAGETATRLGLPGIPATAELIALERDLRLVEMTGAPYHAAQISCAASLEVIRKAKKNGLPVSCGVSINHLTLNENDIGAYRTFFKLSPPLRTEADRAALVAGVADGTVDVIVSSHDPQPADTKRLPFSEAAFGAVGLETLLSAGLSLVHSGELPLPRLITALTSRPAELLGLEGGRLLQGAPADIAVVDIDRTWTVDAEKLHSSSLNTAFEDRIFEGQVVETIVGGVSVYKVGD
jgi:dihydroorotase